MTNKEIERKWLVHEVPCDIMSHLSTYKKKEIIQGYISHSPHIRIRYDGEKYYLNFKRVIESEDIEREEYEYEITKSDYVILSKKTEGIIIYKTRYEIPIEDGLIIELDFFHKEYDGLIYAEIEFEDKEKAIAFVPKDWFFKELTGKIEYTNAGLSKSKIDIYKI
ncbi:MAG: adenylate cyclase [Lachnospiraceae bacterium]|nr:adenylate cyclase [Lachnospiraceae bacterium]